MPFLMFLLPVWSWIKGVFAWLLAHPLDLLIVVLFGALVFQSMRLTHAKHDLAGARASLSTCKANTATLTHALTVQNAAVKAQADKEAHDTAAAQAAVQKAMGGRGEVSRRIAVVEALKPGGNCLDAIRLMKATQR